MEDSELIFHESVTEMYSPQRLHFFKTIDKVVSYILACTDIRLLHQGDYDGWTYFSISGGTTDDVIYDTLEVTAGNRKYLATEVNGVLKFVGYHKKLYFEEESQMWRLVGPNVGEEQKDYARGFNRGGEGNDETGNDGRYEYEGNDDVLTVSGDKEGSETGDDNGYEGDDVLDSDAVRKKGKNKRGSDAVRKKGENKRGTGDSAIGGREGEQEDLNGHKRRGNGNDDVLDRGNGDDDVLDRGNGNGNDDVLDSGNGNDDVSDGSETGDDDDVRKKGENTVSGGERGRDGREGEHEDLNGHKRGREATGGREGEQDNLNGHKRSRNGSASGAGEVRRSGRVPPQKNPEPKRLQITLTKKQGQTKKKGRKKKKREKKEISLHEWMQRLKREKERISLHEWMQRLKREKLGRKSHKSGHHLSEKEREESNLSPSQESSESDFSHLRHSDQRHDGFEDNSGHESGDSGHQRHDGFEDNSGHQRHDENREISFKGLKEIMQIMKIALSRKRNDFEGENGSYQGQKSGNHLSEKEAEGNQSSSHQRHGQRFFINQDQKVYMLVKGMACPTDFVAIRAMPDWGRGTGADDAKFYFKRRIDEWKKDWMNALFFRLINPPYIKDKNAMELYNKNVVESVKQQFSQVFERFSS